MTVVTPWLTFGVTSRSESSSRSSCVCASMKPGAAMRPDASISASAPRAIERADLRDAAVAHADVGAIARRLRAVDDRRVADDQIEMFICIAHDRTRFRKERYDALRIEVPVRGRDRSVDDLNPASRRISSPPRPTSPSPSSRTRRTASGVPPTGSASIAA